MLFRDKEGNIIEILKYNYINDITYYNYIYNKIYNINNNNLDNDNKCDNVISNIIKLIKNNK
jgi:hypothetical protein